MKTYTVNTRTTFSPKGAVYGSILIAAFIASSCLTSLAETGFRGGKSVSEYIDCLKVDYVKMMERDKIDAAVALLVEAARWEKQHHVEGGEFLSTDSDFFRSLERSIPSMEFFKDRFEPRISTLAGFLQKWQDDFPAKASANRDQSMSEVVLRDTGNARFAATIQVPLATYDKTKLEEVTRDLNGFLESMVWVNQPWKVVLEPAANGTKPFSLKKQDITLLEFFTEVSSQCGVRVEFDGRLIRIKPRQTEVIK